MTWEPVPGYLNPNSQKLAISDDMDTWPTSWPDKMDDSNDPGWPSSWNGFFGKNQLHHYEHQSIPQKLIFLIRIYPYIIFLDGAVYQILYLPYFSPYLTNSSIILTIC